MRNARYLGVAAALLLSGIQVRSHTLPISFLMIAPDAEFLHVELVLNPFELSFFSEIDQNHDGRIDASELRARQAEVTKRLLKALELKVGGKRVLAEVAGVDLDTDGHHMTLRAHYKVDARKATIGLASNLQEITSGSHITEVTCRREGKRQSARLDMQTRTAEFEAK